jgi:hypothetical protein
MTSFYQKFVEHEDHIELQDHTLKKASLVSKAMSLLLEKRWNPSEPPSSLQVIDIGSAEGLLSLNLLKDFPNLKLHLTQVNPTTRETDIAQKLMTKYFKGKEPLTILPCFWSGVPVQKYDLVIFFAIFHHVIHTFSSAEEGMSYLAQFVGDVAVIEVPLSTDALLNVWKSKHPEADYSCLDSLESFEALLKLHFVILHAERVQYDINQTSDLHRWCFIVKAKNLLFLQ